MNRKKKGERKEGKYILRKEIRKSVKEKERIKIVIL